MKRKGVTARWGPKEAWSKRVSRCTKTGLVTSCIVASLLLVGTGSSQETMRETYNAFAIVMGTSNPPLIAPGTSVTLQINITRWSTEEEVDDLQAVLVEKGHEGLVEALKKQKKPAGSGLVAWRA